MLNRTLRLFGVFLDNEHIPHEIGLTCILRAYQQPHFAGLSHHPRDCELYEHSARIPLLLPRMPGSQSILGNSPLVLCAMSDDI